MVNLTAGQSFRNTSPSIQNVSDNFPNKATTFVTSFLPSVVETLDIMMTSLQAPLKKSCWPPRTQYGERNASSRVYAVGLDAAATGYVLDEGSPDASSYCRCGSALIYAYISVIEQSVDEQYY